VLYQAVHVAYVSKEDQGGNNVKAKNTGGG